MGGAPLARPRPMRGASTTQSPALGRGAVLAVGPFSATNDVSMNASFAVEVQLNVRELVSIESGSFFERVPEGRGA